MARFYFAPLALSLFQAGHLLAQRLNASTSGAVQMHPSLTWSRCAVAGSCSVVNASIAETNGMMWYNDDLDIHCWEDHVWNGDVCPDPETCYDRCAEHPITDYRELYGITTSNDTVTMKFFTQSTVVNVGNSVLLLDPTSTQAAPTNKYQTFFPLNMEFSFDVDVSQLPCGLASSLSFKEIPADGGISTDPLNEAGAGAGTGNCDGRCSTDRQFIHGLPNVGNMSGACCNEFRLWHGNAVSETMVAHPCSAPGLTTCIAASSGGACATPSCDVTGCEFNPFREGTPASFYGVGPTNALDTSRKFTVVTQFITNSNSSTGALTSIRRFYIQDGTTLPNPLPQIAGITQTDEFTDQHCAEQKVAFGEANVFANLGGLATLGSAFQRGMVLEMGIDEDRVDHMLWLDSTFPPGADPQKPGARRGLCGTDTGVPADVETNNRGAQVVFSNIKFGPIGSTDAFEVTVGSSPATGATRQEAETAGGVQVRVGAVG
ncbi:cellobiohydrolase precursor [Mycena metata]|uniref:Glucanase n=1 Tax=Mycena metata TaxID=1033252 RepID=A0AAD7JQK9_9AGAR|nr:cellobiohydrolase precursor [Mycena metata]